MIAETRRPNLPLSTRDLDCLWSSQATASHDLYTSRRVFEAELDRLFSRAWVFLGHECQVPESGDYFLGHIGRASVIVCRGKSGVVNVLENRCAHRGPAVCSERSGRTPVFVCPYHGWSYNLDGALRGQPIAGDYGPNFPRERRGLRPAAKVGTYRGFIFASFDPDAPDLETFLGETKLAFDNFVDRAPSGSIRQVGVPLRHRIRANWKLVFENLNDAIHPLFAHASVPAAGRKVTGPVEGAARTLNQDISKIVEALKKVRTVATRFGHSYQPGLAGLVGLGAKSAEAHREALSASRGSSEAQAILDADVYVAVVYPSVLIKPGSQNIRIIRPISEDETEVSSYLFALDGAPESVLDDAYDYHYSLGSPASPVLSDDLRIYELIQADYGRGYEVSMERGAEQPGAAPGESSGTSEAYIRGQYDVWRAYLSGEWP